MKISKFFKTISLVCLFAATVMSPLLAKAENDIKLGAILILSGLGAEQGVNSQRGATLAQEEINAAGGIAGRKLKIIFEDEVGPNPRGAVSAFHKLTKIDGVCYFLGPQWQNEVRAVDPLAVKENKFLIIPSTCGAGQSDHTFCLWAEPSAQMEVYARYVYEHSKTVVAFGSNEAWETETLEAFIKSYTKLGGKVLRKLTPNQEVADVRTEALLTKNANPEAIFSSGAIQFVGYRQALARLQVKIPFYTVELFQELINAAGASAEDVIGISPILPEAEFSARFEKRFNAKPDVPSTQAYDAVKMLAAAIIAKGDSVDGVREYFKSFGEFHGAEGTIRSIHGPTHLPLGIYQVRQGKQVLLEKIE